jgi:uncharacterized protein (TIGR02145 family)
MNASILSLNALKAKSLKIPGSGQNSPPGGDCNATAHIRWEEETCSCLNHYRFDAFDFSAIPGGCRGANAGFGHIGCNGYWWSSTGLSSTSAWIRHMGHGGGHLGRDGSVKSNGVCVRCIWNID